MSATIDYTVPARPVIISMGENTAAAVTAALSATSAADAISTLSIAGFRAEALTVDPAPPVVLSATIHGLAPDRMTATWNGYTATINALPFAPPNWDTQTNVLAIGDSMLDAKWAEACAAELGLAIANIAVASSGGKQKWRLGTGKLYFTLDTAAIPVGGGTASVTVINGVAPTIYGDYRDLFNAECFLTTTEGDTNTAHRTIDGYMAGRHVRISVPNAGTPTYTLTAIDGLTEATPIDAQTLFVPDNYALLKTHEVWIRLTQNTVYAPAYPHDVNTQVFDDIQAIIDATQGQRIIILGLTSELGWATDGYADGQDDDPLTAVRWFNDQLRERWPQYALYLPGIGNNFDYILAQAAATPVSGDAVALAAGVVPPSRLTDQIHLNSLGQAEEKASLKAYRLIQAKPPAIAQGTSITLSALATHPRTAAVIEATAVAVVQAGDLAAMGTQVAATIRPGDPASKLSGAPQPIFTDDGYWGGLFDANGYPVDVVTTGGVQISPAANAATAAANLGYTLAVQSANSNGSGAAPIFLDGGYQYGVFDANGYPLLAFDTVGNEVSVTAALAASLNTQVAGVAASGIGPIFLDDGYLSGYFDASGYPIAATPATGGIVGLTGSQMSYQPIFLDDGYVFAIIDSAGATAYGVSTGALSTSYDSLVPVIDTDGAVRLITDTSDVKVAAAVGTVLPAPKIVGNLLRWADRQGTARELRQFGLKPWTAGSYTKIVMVPMYGQSLSIGTNSGALYTTSAIAAGRALMFNGGARPLVGPTWDHYAGTGADDLRGLADGQIITLANLQESLVGTTGETQLSGIAQWLNRSGVTEATSAMLFDTLGIGGCWIDLLKKGTKPYANLLRSIERGKAMAAYLGIAFEVPCIAFDQGESDYSNTAAAYKTALLQLQSDLSTDIAAIMGDSVVRPLVCWQPSSWTASPFNYTLATSSKGILDAAISNPTQIKIIGPQYFDPLYAADGVHKLSQGYRRYGEYAGRAVALVRAGSATGALYATAASVTGTAVSVTFNGNCSIQTGTVTDPGQYGVRLFNTSTSATIALSGISISGSTLTATAASAPTGANWVIGIGDVGTSGQLGGPTTGPRACIRDTSTDTCADGSAMHNWACHQQIAPTIS